MAALQRDAGARPALAVDVVPLTIEAAALHAVLLDADDRPGEVLLPGSLVRMEESLERAALRVLDYEVGVRRAHLEQLRAFGAPDRSPGGRVVTVAYLAVVRWERLRRTLGYRDWQLARLEVPWAGERGGPVEAVSPDGDRLSVALDHAEILGVAVQRLRAELDRSPIPFRLLPTTFTLRELQEVHEAILGRRLNKDSFRRRLLASGRLDSTNRLEQEVGHRPAELYRFKASPAG